MTIRVNGEPRETTAATVAAFVRELESPAETLLVEHNGIALHRSEWATSSLAPNDRLEILKVAAGG